MHQNVAFSTITFQKFHPTLLDAFGVSTSPPSASRCSSTVCWCPSSLLWLATRLFLWEITLLTKVYSAIPSQMALRTPLEAFMTVLSVGVTNMLRESGSLAINFISLDWDISCSAATVISTVPSTRRSRAASATYRTQTYYQTVLHSIKSKNPYLSWLHYLRKLR